LIERARDGMLRVVAGPFTRYVILALAWAFALSGHASAQPFESQAPHAFLYDVRTRSVLYQKAADAPFPPASLIKLMTAEVLFSEMAQQRVTMESEFPISETAWRRGGAPSGGSAMFAALGSRVRVQDLISGLVVMSGNDAALAIAEGISGTEAVFVQRMQARARELGLSRSQFRNATGFSDPEQRVTAREMALLASHVIQTYPEAYALFGQREFTWNRIRQTNRNPLLADMPGADGVKTGNIGESGFNLIGSAQQGDRRLVVVVMGLPNARDRSIEARRLLDWGFRTFEQRTLFNARDVVGHAAVHGGSDAEVPVRIGDQLALMLPRGNLDQVRTRVTYKGPLRAPVTEGTEIGRLSVWRGDILAAEVPVFAAAPVPQGSLVSRARDGFGALTLDWWRRMRGG
jgi:serine-type D-Ala-D-Ala carboxypeptidase (penicillin-binding protein 5/6)